MPISQGQCTIFKKNCLSGLENFAAGTSYVYKIALYTAFAELSYSTLIYTTTNEITGTGYTAGGVTMSGVTISTNADGVVYINFNNVVWPNASFTARGALIYNVTQSNASVAVIDFGADKTCANQTFTVTMPVNSATTALIRFP